MAKQLNISLAFTANTNEAIVAIKNLQKELNNISMGNFGKDSPIKSLTPDIQSAMKSAAQLQATLEGAVNVKTGKLDLGKFSESLDRNKMKLSDYARQLSVLGPIGNKAFLQLAQSISQAEMPLRRSNTLLKELGTSLANTARWQLSSSILHGFMGSVQRAYGYAKDLNKSLNNIRIVTGQSVDQMAKFAVEANKSAKALSTTTTEYTNASLIYYQQGLSDEQVKQRTDITIKMANVSRQSSEEVSNQMTAIWNNFYDGSKSLEYYADAMTALGAATATSTDEIAGGLEKFAAIGDTIGLSYEYAASALATITSNTRQSEEVVGTALKTIFARIQGLNLGETLDDGTTLNKYSQALQKVGINIFESNGEIKKMDKILDEMAAKWQVLAKDQQIALAQTVAGVRQYNQLVALMDNWNAGDSDSMVANLKTVKDSTGALQRQANTYAEGWEGASKRVSASLEKVYQSLLNDEFFIDLANLFSGFVDMIGNIIDAFGGVKGILLVIGNLMTKIFHDEMVKGMNNFAYNIKRLTPSGRKAEQERKEEAWAAVSQLQSSATGNERKAEQTALSQEVMLQRKLMENASRLSEEELKQYQIRLDSVRALQEQAKEQAKAADNAKEILDNLKDEVRLRAKIQVAKSQKEKARKEVEKEDLKAQNTLREKRKKEVKNQYEFNADEVRAAAEEKERKKSKRTKKNKNKFSQDIIKAGDEAVAEAQRKFEEEQQKIDQEIEIEVQALAEQQAKNIEEKTREKLKTTAAKDKNASEQAGKEVDSYTKTLQDLGSTKGLSKTLSSRVSQEATKNMSLKDTRAVAQAALEDIEKLKTQTAKVLKDGNIDLVDAESFKNIEKYEKELKKLLENSQTKAEKLKDVLANIASNAADLRNEAQTEAENVTTDAATNLETPIDAEDSRAIVENAETATIKENKFNKTLDDGGKLAETLGDNIDQTGNKMLSMADKIAYGTQTVMNFGMVLSSLDGMIDTFFNPDMSVWEKTITIITTLGTIIPIAMSSFEAYTKLFYKNTAAAKANAAAQMASATATGVVTGTTAAQTPIVEANANAWKKHPVILIIAAAVAAVVAVFKIFNSVMENNAKKTAESAARAREHADAVKEEAEANTELLNQYHSALKTYEETGEGKQALTDAAMAAAKAYGVEGAAVLALAGDYKALTKALTEKQKKQLQDQKKANNSAILSTNQELLNNLRKGTGHLTNSGNYEGTFGKGFDSGDEQAAYKALSRKTYHYLSKQDDGDIAFRIDDASDPKKVLEYYRELETFIQDQREIADQEGINLEASETYKKALEEFTSGKEQYEQLKKYMSENEGVAAEIAAYDTTITMNGKTQDIWDIDSLKEYQEFEKEFTKNYATSMGYTEGTEEWEKAVQYAKEYLGVFEHLKELSLNNQGFENLTNEKNREEMQEIKDYYDSLSKSEQELFWSVGIDKDSTLDEVKSAMDSMQAYLNSNHIQATIDVMDQAEAALKKGDFKELRRLFTTPEEDGGLGLNNDDYLKFLGLGSEEAMLQWLRNYRKRFSEDSVEGNFQDKAEAKENYNQRVTELEDAQQEQKNAEARAEEVNKAFAEAKTNFDKEYNGFFATLPSYMDKHNSAGYYSFAGLKEAFQNYNVTIGGEEEQKLIDEINLLLSLSEGYSQYLKNSDNDNWRYTASNGEIYDRTNIGEAWSVHQQILANYLGGVTTINGEEIEGADETKAQALKNGVLSYTNLVEPLANDDDFNGLASDQVNGFLSLIKDKLISANNPNNDLLLRDYVQTSQTAYFAGQEVAQKTGEVSELEDDLRTAQTNYIAALETDIELQKQLKQQIEKEGLDVETVNAYRKQLEAGRGLENDTGKNYANEWLAELRNSGDIVKYNEVLNNMSITLARLSKGYKALGTNWEEWNSVMTNSNATIDDTSEIMSDLDNAIADILDWDLEDVKLLPADFYSKNWEVIKEVYEGTDGAIERLAGFAAKEYMLSLGIDTDSLSEEGLIAYTALNNWLESVPDLEIGMTLNDAGIYDAFQALLDSGVITANQMNDILSKIGFTPEIEEKTFQFENNQATKVDSGYDYSYADPITGEKRKAHITDEQYATASSSGNITIPYINSGKTVYNKTGGINIKPPKNQKGSEGSKPQKAKQVDKSDVVERYKEINDKLDDATDAMDDASKAADRLYGADRLKQMQKVNNLIQKEIDLTKQKKQEALEYLKIDRQALIDAGNEAGVSFTIGSDGNIANYTEQMTRLYNELAAAINAANADGNADESEQENIDAIQERVDKVKEAIEQYDETRELIEDLDNEINEKFYEWQDNNAEMLSYKLEIKLELNDMELEKIEYELGKMEDDFYSIAEAGALMLGNLNSDDVGENGQLGTYLQELTDYKNQIDALTESYKNQEISQDAYIEGLKEIRSGIYENLEALQELDKTMMEYYGETIAMAQDELAKYTDQMEHQSSVLEHYASILELIGKSNDYKALGVVLESQLKTAENRAAVAKKNMEMYKDQAAARYAEYQQALAAGDDAAAELYLKQYEAALQAANEAEEEYLSSVEEWGDKIRAVLENTMKGLSQTLENALTGGTSFDQLTTSLERAKSLQEEYLTTTNKIYETNKLMRTAQQAIDKSTNSVAKQRLKGFIEETQQLQDQSKLSQYELEIQQAKYNLLLAEIALEEAQDAKSMVRLQRDSEGNFGYVYTADQAAVGEAESNLLAAQNDLYNISLRGANDYTEKYQQTLSEMYDTLTDLQQQYLDGAFESEEEYNAAVEAAKAYYYKKLKDYSNLYTVAITTDSRVIADAWSTDFADMTGRTEEWMTAVDGYLSEIRDAFAEYEAQMDTLANESVGPDLDSLTEKTEEITEANDELVEKITDPENGVIKAINDELTAVADLTGQYAILRDMLKEVMGEYEDLTNELGTTIEETAKEGEGDTGAPPTPPETPTPEAPTPTGSSETPNLEVGSRVTVKRSATKFATGEYMQGWVPGTSFEVFRINNDTVLIGDRNRSGIYTGWVHKTDLEGFDTGGYTGDWSGAYGKLAMLHKKELVLNEKDTDNFLTGMTIMQRILQTIDLQSMSAQLGGLLVSPSFGMTRDNVLEQNVHIEASFPNATDHNEIEEAFGNLINLASQYANRK